jgi:hypothetical protein
VREIKSIAIAVMSGLIAACSTPSHAPVPQQPARSTDVVNPSYPKNGYKVAYRNGQLLYCRSEALTGTLFRSTVCKTDAQMEAAEQRRQNAVDELGKAHGGECTILKCN